MTLTKEEFAKLIDQTLNGMTVEEFASQFEPDITEISEGAEAIKEHDPVLAELIISGVAELRLSAGKFASLLMNHVQTTYGKKPQ